jgi:hypothetical protein
MLAALLFLIDPFHSLLHCSSAIALHKNMTTNGLLRRLKRNLCYSLS